MLPFGFFRHPGRLLGLLAILLVPSCPGDLCAAETEQQPLPDAPYAKTGDFPSATPLVRPAVLWKFHASRQVGDKGDGSLGVSDPVVQDGVVYFGDDAGNVRALDAATGNVLWETAHGHRIFHSPFVDTEGVYGTADGVGVFALDRKTGAMRWKREIKGTGEAVKVGKTVFVGGGDGILYALDARTGASRWEYDYLPDAFVDPPGFDGKRARFEGSPARPSHCTSDGTTIFQSVFDQCRVVGVDAATGQSRGIFPTQGWIFGNATATDEVLLVGSQDKHCHCFDRRTGELRWKFPTGSRIESGPAIRGDSAFIPSCDGNLYRIALVTGQPIWTFRTTPDQPKRTAIYSAPLLLRDKVCFGAGEGQLYAVDIETGALAWKIRPSESSEMYSSPATDGRRIFVQIRRGLNEQGENAIVAIDESPRP